MTSLGIMTLSRSPYSELDKMSLFQDLKLKRRKVDSRCSSDGESLADTNASSPDLIVPLSPKMCDHGGSVSAQQLHNQQSHERNRNSLSPAALDDDYNSSNATSNSLSIPSGTESPQLVSMDHVMRTLPQTEQRTFTSVTVTTSKLDDSPMQCTANNNNIITRTTTTTTSVASNDQFNMNLSKSIKLINHTNNKNNVIISNHHGRDEIRSDTIILRDDRRRQSRESNEHNHNHNHNNNDNNNNNSESLPNTSVIRLVGETAKSTANSVNVSTAQQRIMSPHATVLVTPLRIKTETNHLSATSYHNNCVSGSTTPITTNAITSMSEYHRKGNMHQNAPPTVVTIETNNHSPNGGNYNSRNCNNNGNINSHATTNLSNRPAMQRIDAESKSNLLTHQKLQVVHTTTTSVASQQQQHHHQVQHQNSINSTGCGGMSIMKNTYSHQNQTQNNNNLDGNRQQAQSQMKNFMFPVNLHAAITNPNPNRIKRERSPIHAINSSTQSLPMSMPQHSHSQSQPSQNPSITTVTPVTSSGQMLHPSLQLQHPANNQNRIMWNSNTRINGVKPEIIGGPIPLRSPVSNSGQTVSTSNQSGQTQRNTPTVIMGESCGVRTMVWGIETPPSTQQQSPHQQTSQTNSISLQNHNQIQLAGPSNNEEAAQLLLSLGQSRPNEMRSVPTQPQMRSQNPLNMERLWAGDYSQLPSGQQIQALNLSSQQQWSSPSQPMKNEQEVPPEDDEQPLVCMICEDKATGLHYGIITCEGCKGFFKRTVQNRRVYTCVADGTCEITKAQRNRCQYCRFKKCIEQGMVLQAVREDRMPGGRNSGAVYNLYKVKYKKHKKSAQKGGQATQQQQQQQAQQQQQNYQQQNYQQQNHQQQNQQQKLELICSDTNSMITSQRMNNLKSENVVNNIPSHLLNGTILKTALTNPSEIVHLRHRLDNAVSSSKDRSVSFEHSMSMIQTLIEFDAMEDIATLPHFPEFLEDKSEIGDKLLNIGDSIVLKLVSWTKKLPFYLEIPVEKHTKLLTDKWHEILVLTTAAYQALHGKKSSASITQSVQHQNQTNAPFLDKDDPEYLHEVHTHLTTLQTCLTTLMRHDISMEQLRVDVGHMVEKMTQITIMFRRVKLKMEEYVCLKVYILLNQEAELEGIQERYIQVMKSYLQHTAPNNPSRLAELLAHIPEIQAAASLLLESKMFYVPFVLNSASVM